MTTRLLAALAALAVLLAATNEWTTWDEGIRLLEASDVRSYETIAAAAPGLPDQDLPAQHARRFVPHWALGSAADATGIDLYALYRVAWGLLVVAIVAALHLTLARLRAGRGAYWLAMALLVANAYAFRYYAIAPGVLADLVLVAGLAWALYGLVARRFAVVAAALVVGAVGRETLIPLLPLILAWIALGPGWRELDARRRALLGAAAAACVLAPYVLLRLVSGPFSLPATLGLSDFGSTPETPPSVGDLTLLSPGSASELGEHALRVLAPHVVPLALLATVLWLARVPPRRLPALFWLGLATWALVVAQPLGLSPEYAADNETRLSAIGLVPLLVAVAAIPLSLRLRPWQAVLAAALLVVASLHHTYATTGPESAPQFVALEVAVAAVLAGLAVSAAAQQPG
ncbi:MAG: hypothetical protein WD844_11200 [Thermoleophilaceae bacterium]